jgi:transcriptional regulator with XRE-family HTH domain
MLSQRELSELAGLHRNAVSRLESVERGNQPRPATVRSLAVALGVVPRWLGDGVGPMRAGHGIVIVGEDDATIVGDE